MPDIESYFAAAGLTYAPRNLFDDPDLATALAKLSRQNPPAPFSMLHYQPLSRIDIIVGVMRDLLQLKHPEISVRPAGGAGHGLFAAEPIAPGTFVGEYTGRIIVAPQSDVQALSDRNDYLFALGMLGPFTHDGIVCQAFIDARPAGNHTRFANHSFSPNCASGSVLLDDGWHVFLATNRAVSTGEQLVYDYGQGYWSTRGAPLPL